jgi:Arc/MetJ-type ribon-helix-helix transcriptional regulator
LTLFVYNGKCVYHYGKLIEVKMPDGFLQVNVSITSEDAKRLDQMMADDAYENRSAFIRLLIRREWTRRQNQLIATLESNAPAQSQSSQMNLLPD